MIDRDRLADDLYLMDKGVRDCCEITIGGTPDEIGEKLRIIESDAGEYKYHVISFLLEKEGIKEYRSVFICKYNYQKILLTKLYNDIKPHSFIYEYMMGTLLGYSAASMEEFLMRGCTDNAIGMSQYTDDDKEDAEKIEKEERKVILVNNNLSSDFDKDAWQVLLSLNSGGTPDSDKINTLTDLLYTHTNTSKERDLVHNLAVAMPNRNKPDFSLCIKILQRYFNVDTEDEETDTSSAEATEEKTSSDTITGIDKRITSFDQSAFYMLDRINQASINDDDAILLIRYFIKHTTDINYDYQQKLIVDIANVLNVVNPSFPMSNYQKVYHVIRILENYFGLPHYDDSTFKPDLKEMYYFFKDNKPKDCINKVKDLANKYHISLTDAKNKYMLASIISNIDSKETITAKRTRIIISIEEFLRGDPKVVLEDRRKYVEAVEKLKDTISSLTSSSDFFDIINVFLRIDTPCYRERLFKTKMIATMSNPSLAKLDKLNYINQLISNYLDYVNKNGY